MTEAPEEPKGIKEAKEIIAHSGNLFHSKVMKMLHDYEWTTLISPYYQDNISGKPREIDIVAEKNFFLDRSASGNIPGYVCVRLYIECKYISQTTVFWLHEKDLTKAIELITSTTPCKENIKNAQKHHYYSQTYIAKLFGSIKNKDADSEVFYKALNQCLNATIYYRKGPPLISEDYTELARLNYPVIMCNNFDKLYYTVMDHPEDPKPLDKNFLLEVNYAQSGDTTHKNEYFLIDTIDFNKFDEFINIIKQDIKLIQDTFGFHA